MNVIIIIYLFIPVPPEEPPSLLYSSSSDIGLIYLNGSFVSKSTNLNVQTLSLDFDHRNRSVCYVRRNSTNPSFKCVSLDNFEKSWDLPKSIMFPLHCTVFFFNFVMS